MGAEVGNKLRARRTAATISQDKDLVKPELIRIRAEWSLKIARSVEKRKLGELTRTT
jgi:hypothetical protein